MMQGGLQAPGRSTTNEPSVQEWSQADTHACAAGGVGRMEGGYNGGGYRGYRGRGLSSTVVCEQIYISVIFHFVLSSINLGLEWRQALMLVVENVQH